MYHPRVIKSNCVVNLCNIELDKEYTGYNFYLPVGFLHDLIHFIVHKNRSNKYIFAVEDEITDFLSKIPDNIISIYKSESNVLHQALYVLKYLGNKTDLLMIENNTINDVEDNLTNYKNNLDFKLDNNLCTYENLQYNDILNSINSLLSYEEDSCKTKNKIIGFKKPLSLKKHNLMRPDYSYILTKESGKHNELDDDKKSFLIFIEDTSSSMSSEHNRTISNLLKSFISYMNKDIHYYCNGEFIILKTLEEKLNKFSTTQYYSMDIDYEKLFKQISKRFFNQKLIILNDGEDFMPSSLILNNQVFIFNTGITNKNAISLCKLNNGKQIKL
jgi:hypothetical protein